MEPTTPKKAPKKGKTCQETSGNSKALPGPHDGGNQSRGPGAPLGNQNALKHGLYSKFVPLEILDQAAGLMASDPAERRRWRAAIFEAKWLEAINQNAPLEALSRAASVMHTMDQDAPQDDTGNGPSGLIAIPGDEA